MIVSLAANRNCNADYDITLRRSRTTRPGRTGMRTNRTHPARLGQHQRNYQGIVTGEYRRHHYETSDRVTTPQRGFPRPPVKGVNVPADGESWEELNAWRERYNFSPVTQQ